MMKRQLFPLAALTAAFTLSTAVSSVAATPSWQETGTAYTGSLTGGEGLASRADGSLLYRGLGSIPLDLRIKGWNHVGDPDIAQGYTFDAYQGPDTATSKMFEVTTPDGKRYDYVHQLDSGEALNNSFDSVSPDSQWMVSGEWGDQNRLQVFPTPLLNPSTPRTGGALPQAGQITLDKPVRDIQACDFVNETRLVCVSDDGSRQLFPDDRPLLQVDLPHKLDGQPITGRVTDLLALPQRSLCTGTFEAEGVDYDTARGVLRAEVVQPGVCVVATTVYSYREQ